MKSRNVVDSGSDFQCQGACVLMDLIHHPLRRAGNETSRKLKERVLSTPFLVALLTFTSMAVPSSIAPTTFGR
jgi:hypothetical protein